ncbi:hypothetical protein CDIK_2818 [Cucumispora dikerogammari]|nr:hypothetical protein CDIK_2818 [Cucumispora dikerogammari]
MIYTRKRLVKIPEERNSTRNINARQEYCSVINHISDNKLVFPGETGVNLHHSKNYGYSSKNAKAIKVVKGKRGQNICSLVVIKDSGFFTYETKDGDFEGNVFIEFIRNKLIPHFENNPDDILIMDNRSFHHRIDVIAELEFNNINHWFLPAYSSQLNPIEEYFSHFKAKLASNDQRFINRNELKTRINNILNTEDIVFLSWF